MGHAAHALPKQILGTETRRSLSAKSCIQAISNPSRLNRVGEDSTLEQGLEVSAQATRWRAVTFSTRAGHEARVVHCRLHPTFEDL